MSKFIKVVQWNGGGYYNAPSILYISVDIIKHFYRVDGNISYNFRPYFEGEQIVQDYYYNPTKIITKEGDIYYSPVDLNNSQKFDIEEIESRFDIIDL